MTKTIPEAHRTGRIAMLAFAVLATIAMVADAQAADASDYKVNVRNSGSAVAVEQAPPQYPRGDVKRGQEGWVRMSYVVSDDGKAIDPIILDSSGGAAFEKEARDVVAEWRFEAATDGQELPYNIVNIRSEITRGKDAATADFIRRTKYILTYLHQEENAIARSQADIAYKTGGWNLYESTMLWLMLGRVEGAEGDSAGKLEMYNRALALSNSKSIPSAERVELLEKIFLLQSQFQQYAAALRTIESLKKTQGSESAVERHSKQASEFSKHLSGDDTVTATATISLPCDCEEGQALWHYVPARRSFSFDVVQGNVDRFEARCEGKRIKSAVQSDKRWVLAPDWGACRVYVFGDDGATFNFLEHLDDGGENSSKPPEPVVRTNVLD